jgi:hypothetical protein
MLRLTVLVIILTLAGVLTGCSQKREEFETAKTAVAQELRFPNSARFCPIDQAEFSSKNGAHAVRLWVDNQNLAGALVRTHFEVIIDPKNGLVKGATCLECAAEDEKQKLNEAVDELQGLNSPSSSPLTSPARR